MSAVIGALRVNLGMNSTAFMNGLDEASKRIAKAQKNFDQIGAKMGRIGKQLSVALSAPLAGLAALSQASAHNLTALDNQARAAGLTAERFKVLALASSQFGVEQEKVADILKDVNDKLGDYAQTGAGPLADFFENIAPKVGLTLREFSGLTSEQVLQKYVGALDAANLSQAEMTFYLEALASDATALMPVFRNAGAAIKSTEARARELGLALDQDVIRAARQATQDFGLMREVLGVQFQAAIAKLLPAFSALISSVEPVFASMVGGIQAVADAFTGLSPQAQKFIVVATGIAAALGPVIVALGAITASIGALLPVVAALLGPVGLAVGALAALVAVAVKLRTHTANATNATDTLTTALGDEIRQSQGLSAVLNTSNRMSVDAAEKKLTEARARHENVKAIIAEQRALALNSTEFADLTRDIKQAQDGLNAIGFPYSDAVVPSRADAFEEQQQRLADLIIKRQALLKADEAAAEQVAQTEENIRLLEDALAKASGGFVEFEGEVVDVVEVADRLNLTIDDIDAGLDKLGRNGTKALKKVETAADRVDQAFKGMWTRLASGDPAGAISGWVSDIKGMAAESFGGLLDKAFNGGGFSAITGGLKTAFSGVSAGVKSLFSGGGLGAIGGIVTSALPIIGAINTVIGLIKGFSTKTTIGAGLRIGVDDGQLAGGTFETIKKTTFWGLFSSTKTYEKAFEAEAYAALQAQVDAMQGVVRETYKAAGVSVTDAMVRGVDLAIQKFDTRDMSEEEVDAKIAEIFGKYGDAISQAIGQVDLRVAAIFAEAKAFLEPAGQGFIGTFKEMAEAADALATLAGGIDALQSGVSGFVDRFFTDAEKLGILNDQIAATFADLGLVIPKTRDGFKELVMSQDLMTESGRAAYAALLNIGPAFDAVSGSIDALMGRFGDGGAEFVSDFDSRLAQIAAARNLVVSQDVFSDGAVQQLGALSDLRRATDEQVNLTRRMLNHFENWEIYGLGGSVS